MPGVRKRENRENVFYNVGEQGRKTGITLEDKGVRDEYGMEPVSGIFSSPEKSPPKRSSDLRRTDGTVTESESMDIQESSIPDLTPGHILRNNRTSLPPPRSRSPMKTSLGATPRRSMGPKSIPRSPSPTDQLEIGSAVNRRLFGQEETSLQETPVSNGSGGRRENRRRDIYTLEQSPVYQAHEDETANDVSELVSGLAEDSFAGAVEEDMTMEDTNGVEESIQQSIQASIQDSMQEEESMVEEETAFEEEPVKQPQKRGRKRKSETLESVAENESPAAPPKETRTGSTQASAAQKTKKAAPAPVAKPRGRPPRARPSDVTEEEPSIAQDVSMTESAQPEEASAVAKPKPRGRGRPPKAQAEEAAGESIPAEEPAPAKRRGPKPKAQASQATKSPPSKEPENQSGFKKPAAPKSKPKASAKPSDAPKPAEGTYVDTLGKPISKDELDLRSTTSAGSRFRRGRALSVFKLQGPEAVDRTSRLGRHIHRPVDFWMNEKVVYDVEGNMKNRVEKEEEEPAPRKRPGAKGRSKKVLAAVEEEELEDWEVNEGVVEGLYRAYDAATGATLEEQRDATLAWAERAIRPTQIPSAQFKFTKLDSVGDGNSFFNWGCIELEGDDIKRSKNSRKMHMVFHVTKGAVEVKVNDTTFTIHEGGVWQVPRGNQYSIANVSKKTSRMFFAQACEIDVEAEG